MCICFHNMLACRVRVQHGKLVIIMRHIFAQVLLSFGGIHILEMKSKVFLSRMDAKLAARDAAERQ